MKKRRERPPDRPKPARRCTHASSVYVSPLSPPCLRERYVAPGPQALGRHCRRHHLCCRRRFPSFGVRESTRGWSRPSSPARELETVSGGPGLTLRGSAARGRQRPYWRSGGRGGRSHVGGCLSRSSRARRARPAPPPPSLSPHPSPRAGNSNPKGREGGARGWRAGESAAAKTPP